MRLTKTSSLLSSTQFTSYSASRQIQYCAYRIPRSNLSLPGALAFHLSRSLNRFFSVSRSRQSSPTSASAATLSYRVGAAFSAKGRRFNPNEDRFNFTPQLPASSEQGCYTGRPKSGQDAFFISGGPGAHNVAFGVTDGVGGWSNSGIDSAHFSHGLCQWMAKIAEERLRSEKKLLAPRQLLQNAYDSIVRDGTIVGGGSTACIVVGGRDGTLQVTNLGDSGFIQLRLNAVHHFSNPQTHAFNTPYQLSVVPPRILALTKLLGGKQLNDSPKDSNDTSHKVRHGDVLIFATDGVWDNLSQLELLKVVSRQMVSHRGWETGDNGTRVSSDLRNLTQKSVMPKQLDTTLQTLLAMNIVQEAKAASMNSKRDGPFAKEVQKNYPHEKYHGGKVDDICVVVAIVVRDQGDNP